MLPVVRKIEEGGMSSIWTTELPGEIAKMTPRSSSHADHYHRREVTCLNLLMGSDKVARYRGELTSPNFNFIFLEHYPLGNLYNHLVNTRGTDDHPTFEEKIDISIQLTEVLIECHSLNIIHRDVKLDNILLSSIRPYSIKLIDFALAFLPDGNKKPVGAKGTPFSAAPEILRNSPKGIPYDYRVDCWSLGSAIHELFTLRNLFCGTTEREVMGNRLRGAKPIISYHLSDLSSELYEVVEGLLVDDPFERWSLEKALNALRSIRNQNIK